ncbi:hypothetical protein AB4Z10_25080 [Bosea sp. RAF48]|uniref:hypothetical protein n=1 Tax=Bosea sp. RAF48 TaxID=3237480 RepID=UPI003F8F5AA2
MAAICDRFSPVFRFAFFIGSGRSWLVADSLAAANREWPLKRMNIASLRENGRGILPKK